jgi:type II secretory pathway pseudopilin PulG
MTATSRRRQRGVSYLVLLLTMALSGVVIAGGATVWSQAQRRERETQLLWAGGQIRQAIASYARMAAQADPGTSSGAAGLGANRYPARLEDLLRDDRSLTPRRFLRQIYPDPITRSSDWGLIRNEAGRIVGVYSPSEQAPIKTGNFASTDADFEGARRYADWHFSAVATPGLRRLPGAPARSGASAAKTLEMPDIDPAASASTSTWRPRPMPQVPMPSTPGLLRPLPGTTPGQSTTAASAPGQRATPPPASDEPATPAAEPVNGVDSDPDPAPPPEPPGDSND